MTMIIAGSGFHNSAIVVNPSDLAPKHSGSVFGFMNTVGSVPGKILKFKNIKLISVDNKF